MRALGVLLSLSMVSALFAQDTTTAGRSPWRIGVSGWYGAGYRRLVSDASNTTTNAIIKFRNDLEEPSPAYGTGVDVTYDLGRHWSLASGFQFISLGYRTEKLPLVSIENPEGIDPAIPFARVGYLHQYLAIPAVVRYRIGTGRFHFEPGLGVSAELLLDSFSVLEKFYSNGDKSRSRTLIPDDRYSGTMVSALCELNLQYRIGQRWELRLAPQARYQLFPMSDTSIADQLYAGGLGLGCLFRL